MRLEFGIELGMIEVPRFSVEAVEGIGKLFTLATLILNVLDSKQRVEIIFHGLSAEDPERKIAAFQEIVASCQTAQPVRFQTGNGGLVSGSSSYYEWLTVQRG
ncbi:MAG: hypothetical protein O7G30_17015 [Proteobacteria bacterium]|nr:hypothetical protein [Pseudomonadota bacterium]